MKEAIAHGQLAAILVVTVLAHIGCEKAANHHAVEFPEAVEVSCESIRIELTKEPAPGPVSNACTQDSDCSCYGGPVCPNTFVSACPDARTRSATARGAVLEQQWQERDCGG